jgi:hypothetical protein
MANEKMSDSQEDTSMLLYRAAGMELASPDIALALAEMVFKKTYGQEDFETQKPLRLSDGGDRWIVEGSRRPNDYATPPGHAAIGTVYIEILKANCQIMKLSQKAHLPIK